MNPVDGVFANLNHTSPIFIFIQYLFQLMVIHHELKYILDEEEKYIAPIVAKKDKYSVIIIV